MTQLSVDVVVTEVERLSAKSTCLINLVSPPYAFCCRVEATTTETIVKRKLQRFFSNWTKRDAFIFLMTVRTCCGGTETTKWNLSKDQNWIETIMWGNKYELKLKCHCCQEAGCMPRFRLATVHHLAFDVHYRPTETHVDNAHLALPTRSAKWDYAQTLRADPTLRHAGGRQTSEHGWMPATEQRWRYIEKTLLLSGRRPTRRP